MAITAVTPGTYTVDPAHSNVGFDLTATLDRTDFGLSFNQTVASGNLLVANKIKLLVAASAVKAA